MSTPTPGWYPDPQQPGTTRWWDGTGWTAHTMPGGPQAAHPPAAVAPKKSGGFKVVAIVLLSVLGVLLVLGVLAAIAVPVFLNQRAKADAAATGSSSATGSIADQIALATCEQVGAEAVDLSQREPDVSGGMALQSLVGLWTIDDGRDEFVAPVGDDEAYVMTCRGVGTWEDAATGNVDVELYVDSTGLHLLSLYPAE